MTMKELMIVDSVGPSKPQEDAGQEFLESISSREVQQRVACQWTIDLTTSPEPEVQQEIPTC